MDPHTFPEKLLKNPSSHLYVGDDDDGELDEDHFWDYGEDEPADESAGHRAHRPADDETEGAGVDGVGDNGRHVRLHG